jgi:very-short-patch-repair endonuclease
VYLRLVARPTADRVGWLHFAKSLRNSGWARAFRGILGPVRELNDRKDTIEEEAGSSRESLDADRGQDAGKSAHSPEDTPRFGRFGSDSDPDRPNFVPILGQRALLPVMGHHDRRIAAIAELQRGLVSRSQLLAAGISTASIKRMLATGSLWPTHQGVYSVGCSIEVPLARETAALLAVGPNALLSHRSAAVVWGICRARPDDAPVDVLIGPRRRTRRDGIAAHRTKRLERAEIRIHERLPVTSPARTVCDIAGAVSMRELERAVDEALIRRLVRLQQLRDAVAKENGRRGGPILAALLDHRGNSTVTRSQAEERMLELVRAANFPPPETNVRLNGYEVDFLWRPQRLIVEIDGYAYHSSRSAFERDRAKDAALAAAGYLVIRITWLQMEREPYVVVARLAQALAQRS